MVITAARMGAAPATLTRMLLNLALDVVLGAVPLLGDLFDLIFKANRRNLRIVQDQVVDPDGTRIRSRAVVWGAVVGVVGVIGSLVALLGWAAAGAWGLLAG
jgi:hypothetical protein